MDLFSRMIQGRPSDDHRAYDAPAPAPPPASYANNFQAFAFGMVHRDTHSEQPQSQSDHETASLGGVPEDSDVEDYTVPKLDLGEIDDEDEFEERAMDVVDEVIEQDPELLQLKEYFEQKLVQFLISNGGDLDTAQRWVVQVIKHAGGLSAGTIDVYYYSPPPKRKKFRSRVEVGITLGLLRYARTIKSMPRDELQMLAAETRERYLLPLQLQMLDTSVAKGLTYAPSISEQGTMSTDDESQTELTCFRLGNFTILEWGRIVPKPGFHTSSQLFPVGFKCIRQEHDLLLDRVVDCLCEIEARPVFGEPQFPWFKISVAWDVEGTAVVKVYEGDSPRVVWEQVMLETLGAPQIPTFNSFSGCANRDPISFGNNAEEQAFEEEEEELRNQLLDIRKKHITLLKRPGKWTYLQRPRLTGVDLESFVDDPVLRLIEGMEGSKECRLYNFLDTRSSISGKKHMLKQLGASAQKAKHLDKVKKKLNAERDKEEQRRRKLEVEAKRRERRQEKINRQMRDKVDREKIRDIEKYVKSTRSIFDKDIVKRKESAKSSVKAYHLKEQGRSEEPKPVFHSVQARSAEKEDRHFPNPPGHDLQDHLPPDIMSTLLQVWDFTCTFAQSFEPPVKSVPSLKALQQALFSAGVEESQVRDQFHSQKVELESHPLHVMATTLIQPLVPEYYKLIGLGFEASAPMESLPINRYTWQEIARQLIWAYASKDIGISEIDRVMNVRSRGCINNLDISDRRAVRLLRLRMLCMSRPGEYITRFESFKTGIVLRIPTPRPADFRSHSWEEHITILKGVPVSQASTIKKLIERAIEATNDCTVRSKLSEAIAPNIFRVSGIGESKRLAVKVLDVHGTKNAGPKERENDHSSSSGQESVNAVPTPLIINPDSVGLTPSKILQLSEKHLGGLATQESVIEVAAIKSMNQNDAEIDDLFGGMDDQARQPSIDEDDDEDDEYEAGTVVTPSKSENLAKDTILSASEQLERDSIPQVELSDAFQRCCKVMDALTANVHAYNFVYHVDPKALPDYYATIRQPLPLENIISFLRKGKFPSIVAFFDDCRLVFENCRCYNSEGAPVMLAMERLAAVFERAILDWVLDVTVAVDKISVNECFECKVDVDEDKDVNHAVVCDRCSARFHLQCVSLQSVPKGDWFCPNCVSSRNVSDVHPCMGKQIFLDSKKHIGTVTALERSDNALLFLVVTEDGNKRRYVQSDAAWRSLVHAVKLPDGYTTEDYDKICMMSRGYAGWGGPYFPFPANLSSAHSHKAYRKENEDFAFQSHQRALLALTQGIERMSARDWLSVLLSFQVHVLSSSRVLAQISAFESQCIVLNNETDKHQASTCNDEQELPIPLIPLPQVMVEEFVEEQELSLTLDEDEDYEDDELCEQQEAKSEDGELSEAEAELWDTDEEPSPSERVSKRKLGSIAEEDEDGGLTNDTQARNAKIEVDKSQPGVKKHRVDDSADAATVFENSLSSNTQAANYSATLNQPTTQSPELAPDVVLETTQQLPLDGEDEEDGKQQLWQRRRISRNKGRDDLLFTRTLLEELFSKIAESLHLHDINLIVTIARTCLHGMPQSALIPDEWCTAFLNRGLDPPFGVPWISDPAEPLPEIQPGSNHPLCAFCGFTEEYLGSQFVFGQTLEEWNTGYSLDHLSLDERRILEQKFRSEGKTRVRDVWIPVRPEDEKVEIDECLRARMPYRRGSLVVHECCADFMSAVRRGVLKCDEELDDALYDRLVGIGRGKGNRLGTDTGGRLYWYFAATPQQLYVEPKRVMDVRLFTDLQSPGSLPHVNIHGSTSVHSEAEQGLSWMIFEGEGIERVMAYLNGDIQEERILMKILQKLFPQAYAAYKITPRTHYYQASSEQLGNLGLTEATDQPEVGEEVPSIGSQELELERVVKLPDTPIMSEPMQIEVEAEGEPILAIQGDKSGLDSKSDEEARNGGTDDGLEKENGLDSDEGEESPSGRKTRRRSRQMLQEGEVVLVEKNGARGKLLWPARVIRTRLFPPKQDLSVLVRYEGWPDSSEEWVEQSKARANSRTNVEEQSKLRRRYVKHSLLHAPEPLASLNAVRHLDKVDRARDYLDDSVAALLINCDDAFSVVKAAILVVESALPVGAWDMSEDKWSEQLSSCWLQHLMYARTPVDLMECQLMLEFCLLKDLVRDSVRRTFTCLPSRSYALKYANLGAVALRLWLLDQGIMYDKATDKTASHPPKKRGRPKSGKAKGRRYSRS